MAAHGGQRQVGVVPNLDGESAAVWHQPVLSSAPEVERVGSLPWSRLSIGAQEAWPSEQRSTLDHGNEESWPHSQFPEPDWSTDPECLTKGEARSP